MIKNNHHWHRHLCLYRSCKKCALWLVLHGLHHRVLPRYYSPPLLYTGTDKQLSGAVKEEGKG